jgi:hypothetical protein
MKTILLPEITELEAFRRSVNRKIWTVVLGLLVVALATLGLLLVVLARPIPVVAIDQEGRPILFKDTVSPRIHLENTRVEYFSKEFLGRFMCVDSLDVAEDFAAALNGMTPRLRKIVLADEKEAARRAQLKSDNMKSRIVEMKTKIGGYDPDQSDGRVNLVAWGKLHYSPRLGGDNDMGVDHFFYAQLVLQRVPVSEVSIHGLLVDFVQVKFFDQSTALDAHLLKEGGEYR